VSRLFAITTCGLEAVAAREIAEHAGMEVLATSYRRVSMRTSGGLAALSSLRTIDDCFIELAIWEGLSHTRAALPILRSRAGSLKLDAALAQLRLLREIDSQPTFAITVNFVGRRNYSSDEIKEQLADAIHQTWGWHWQPRDDVAQVNVRIFIDHDVAHVGMRLFAQPLHERHYKRHHLPGSLRPPVAAAMVKISGLTVGQHLIDPCCGGATILIEAAMAGALARGGDQDPLALDAARANALAAGVDLQLEAWDVRALPVADGSIDHLICNLPWDRQVAVDAELRLFHEHACQEIARILKPSGKATLLTIHHDLVHIPGRTRGDSLEISLHGQRPRIICES
jgi:tRNA (guanine6-N2)-methyltransferase